jgi:hypothetical protein
MNRPERAVATRRTAAPNDRGRVAASAPVRMARATETAPAMTVATNPRANGPDPISGTRDAIARSAIVPAKQDTDPASHFGALFGFRIEETCDALAVASRGADAVAAAAARGAEGGTALWLSASMPLERATALKGSAVVIFFCAK